MSIYENNAVVAGYAALRVSEREINERLTAAIIAQLRARGYYRILDIGCGLAPLLPHLCAALRKMDTASHIFYSGLDGSEAMLQHNRQSYGYLCDDTVEIEFRSCNITELNELIQFPWYNIIIAQSVIHLLLPAEVVELYKFVSKSLASDGVFYVSTKLDVDVQQKNNSDDFHVVRKAALPDQPYLRRIYTASKFISELGLFEQEGSYRLFSREDVDSAGHRFLVAFVSKPVELLYGRYHYALGFDARLLNVSEQLAACRGVKEYVHDLESMRVIRREGYLMALYESDRAAFQRMMQLFRELVQRAMPGSSVLYLKDKLNANPLDWKFPLHQDASTGWNERMRAHLRNPNFVTLGIPLAAVTQPEQGPTRIAIRQGYSAELVNETTPQHTVETGAYEQRLGKPLQYLLCVGRPGCYYLFDQYVLHDSAYNLQEQSRDVWFVTLALSEEPDDPRSDSIALAQEFYQSKGALDKQAIEKLLASGVDKSRLKRDNFGKFSLET